MHIFSLIIRTLMVLVAVYYFVKPEKLIAKRPKLTVGRLRVLLGAAICLWLLGFYFQYRSEHTQDQKVSIASVETKLHSVLDQYPKELQQTEWTKLCQKGNVDAILAQTPQLPRQTAELIGLTVCTCMAHELGGTPEFKKSEELMVSGKTFVEAIDTAYAKTTGVLDRIKPCQDLGI